MNKKRPVNLELNTISLPITAIASILHRVSAVIIWVALAFFLPTLYISLGSPEGFDSVKSMVSENFLAQFVIWGFLTAGGYYAMAGMKHIIQDMGHFEELESGMLISKVVIGVGIVISLLFGAWIWA
ncbi:succinate dehydrogenase, cytochrome b556 subunit [Marinomonas sp. C2222]|uniref:Succinate dehydrogenase cytochrome b556 subunit n=1 Tax=Marinomonas sargassi TaxID=2984494 RepID=A0ABT2YRU2_9GAMM|nr:succinate dehydrogenase, cytochrome b556 subunit [Marinomonas sargassi]MCV2402591.1 succinate dehydrogenase, cytochrome b556 subunit [Marinomonas sargassi]